MKPVHWLLAVSVVAIVVMIILWPKEEPKTERVTELERAVAIADIRIASLLQDSAKQAEKRKADSLQQAQEKKTYIVTIEKKSREIENLKANPVVVKIRETTPEVNALIIEMGRMDSVKTERIARLENDKDALRIDMRQMESNFGELLEAEREKFQAQGQMLEQTMQENKKIRRANRWLKVALPVAGLAGLILGNNL